MGVDETRHDRRFGVVVARAELVDRADGGDAPVLDRDSAAFDRRPFDRKDPVSGKNLAQGSVRLAGSGLAARRSMSTESQIEPSYRAINGTISKVVVTGSIPGSNTAITATMK